MKIRTNFVSNSSSSSFVVAVKKTPPKSCPVCGCCGQNILDLLSWSNYYDNTVVYRGQEVIDSIQHRKEYCKKQGYTQELKYLSNLLQKVEPYITNDQYELAEIEVSYHDQAAINTLKFQIKNKDVIILDNSSINDQEFWQ